MLLLLLFYLLSFCPSLVWGQRYLCFLFSLYFLATIKKKVIVNPLSTIHFEQPGQFIVNPLLIQYWSIVAEEKIVHR